MTSDGEMNDGIQTHPSCVSPSVVLSRIERDAQIDGLPELGDVAVGEAPGQESVFRGEGEMLVPVPAKPLEKEGGQGQDVPPAVPQGGGEPGAFRKRPRRGPDRAREGAPSA